MFFFFGSNKTKSNKTKIIPNDADNSSVKNQPSESFSRKELIVPNHTLVSLTEKIICLETQVRILTENVYQIKKHQQDTYDLLQNIHDQLSNN